MRHLDASVVFQVDSLLVAKQAAKHDSWACRSPELVPLRDECRRLTEILSAAGVEWVVRHIFREFNQTADALANQAVEEQVRLFEAVGW